MKQTNAPQTTQEAASPPQTTSVAALTLAPEAAATTGASALPRTVPAQSLWGSGELEDDTLGQGSGRQVHDNPRYAPDRNHRTREPMRGRDAAAGSRAKPSPHSRPPTSPPLDRLISLEEVMRRTTFSKATVYRKAADKSFPAPIKIGRHRVAWRASELASWLDALPRAA